MSCAGAPNISALNHWGSYTCTHVPNKTLADQHECHSGGIQGPGPNRWFIPQLRIQSNSCKRLPCERRRSLGTWHWELQGTLCWWLTFTGHGRMSTRDTYAYMLNCIYHDSISSLFEIHWGLITIHNPLSPFWLVIFLICNLETLQLRNLLH